MPLGGGGDPRPDVVKYGSLEVPSAFRFPQRVEGFGPLDQGPLVRRFFFDGHRKCNDLRLGNGSVSNVSLCDDKEKTKKLTKIY